MQRSSKLFALLLGVVIALQLFAAFRERGRPLAHDESEYVHAAWLMHEGLVPYRDFLEDHTPFLFIALEALMPERTTDELPLLDIRTWATRARTIIALIGATSLLAIVLLVARGTGDRIAGVFAAALAIGGVQSWFAGFEEIRADPIALACFLGGCAMLVLRPRRPLTVGIALALVSMAALWNPKWPLASLVVAGFALADLRRFRGEGVRAFIAVLAPSLVVAAVGFWMIVETAPLQSFVDVVLRLKPRTAAAFGEEAWTRVRFEARGGFSGVPPILMPAWTAAAAILAMFGRHARGNPRPLLFVSLLLIAIGAEVRFLYPYPFLWVQYYVLWIVAAATMWGFALAALAELVEERLHRDATWIRATLAGVAILTMGVTLWPHLKGEMAADPNGWDARAHLQQRLSPGDTVWVGSDGKHPIAARDSSFYWYSFPDLLPLTLRMTRGETPMLRERDLPPCAIADGRDTSTRFIEVDEWVYRMGDVCRCTSTLFDRGMLVPTPIPTVFEVLIPGRAPAPPARFAKKHIAMPHTGAFDASRCTPGRIR